MAKSRSQFVVDANVLIDLRDGRILDRLARIPEEFIVADIVVADDIDEPDEAALAEAGIRIHNLSGTAVQAVIEVTASCRRVSTADAASMVLAEEVGFRGHNTQLISLDSNRIRVDVPQTEIRDNHLLI